MWKAKDRDNGEFSKEYGNWKVHDESKNELLLETVSSRAEGNREWGKGKQNEDGKMKRVAHKMEQAGLDRREAEKKVSIY